MSDSAIIGVTLIVSLAGLAGIVLWKHTLDDAMKVIAVLGTLAGTVLGSLTSYFFTREPLRAAAAQVAVAQETLKHAQVTVAGLEEAVRDLRSSARSPEVTHAGIMGEMWRTLRPGDVLGSNAAGETHHFLVSIETAGRYEFGTRGDVETELLLEGVADGLKLASEHQPPGFNGVIDVNLPRGNYRLYVNGRGWSGEYTIYMEKHD